ncbi:alpha/beta hydrolase [Mycetocola miduiensis]|uniref:Alpha/beta hydrolase fold n=1 Tax=Mycetocola miduiensis TaxID=995034 RepID=A0A1I4Y9W4_9MICO|nr:alpha/beta hydrolase [Mycetocola miduiensis]SFN34848.1 alpha/beta hydrolase fold [Mycetocola miduiensis]
MTRPTATTCRVRMALLALPVCLALSLSGCVTAFFPAPETTSTPTGEDVADSLRPFYEQQLIWEPCNDGMQCSTATAPMDWENPDAGDIELALVRKPASGNPIGSLLINPGGPGASGFDYIAQSVDAAADARLQANFDIVGFDPRGVNRSTPVSCLEPAEMDEYLYGIADNERGSEAWIAEVTASAEGFAAACAENTGEFLEFVDTVSAARDLDMLRASLGDEKLNYLGYSYGTFLGASYAELHPKTTGRLVLDGAIDPASSIYEVNEAQAKGFESALAAYLDACLGSRDCPFTGSAEEALSTIGDLMASVDETPIKNSDGRKLGASALLTAIIYPLYFPAGEAWPQLSEMLASVMNGNAEYAFAFADAYNGRLEDGTYDNNTTEAFIAYNCRDYTHNADPARMAEEAAKLAKAAPVIGPYFGYGDIGCAAWSYPDGAERDEIHAAGAAPILVIGTTNDPATPYVWAEALADQLESGVLVTYQGEGHTGYNKGSRCVDAVVDDFFIDGTVPGSDPQCS